MTARIVADDLAGRAAAVEILRSGGIVALPTDTVYGIAVSPATPGGIERLFHVKRRPLDKGIALLLESAAQAATIGVMGAAATVLADACWPGGLTLVVPQRTDVALPDVLTGGAPTIGLRVADHPTPRALAGAVGPMPTTSANVSGRAEAADAAGILEQLGDAIDLILDGGPAHGGPASTVVDCSGELPRVIREGAIPAQRIEELLAAAGLALDVARLLSGLAAQLAGRKNQNAATPMTAATNMPRNAGGQTCRQRIAVGSGPSGSRTASSGGFQSRPAATSTRAAFTATSTSASRRSSGSSSSAAVDRSDTRSPADPLARSTSQTAFARAWRAEPVSTGICSITRRAEIRSPSAIQMPKRSPAVSGVSGVAATNDRIADLDRGTATSPNSSCQWASARTASHRYVSVAALKSRGSQRATAHAPAAAKVTAKTPDQTISAHGVSGSIVTPASPNANASDTVTSGPRMPPARIPTTSPST